MKSYSKLFLIALLTLAAVLFTGVAATRALADEQQKKAAPAADAQEEETPYDEEEYNMLMAAINEPDLAKRGPKLLEFMQKYPKTTLIQHVNSAYIGMLKECSAGKKYDLLESHAEKWLKLHPNDLNTLAFIAEATNNLQKYQRCVECMEEIYNLQPQPTLAKDIFLQYQKMNNLPKQLEWFDKLSKMSEFDTDYMLRFGFVLKYMESKNLPKAAEFANLTLKSADLVKPPDADTEQILGIRRACYSIIGSSLSDKDKFAEAIPYFKKAIKIKKTTEDYYNIALCLHKQKEVEEANVYYAAAELMGGEGAAKAKSTLEEVYRVLHNNSLIGIEKVYRKAKEMMAETEKAQN
jgi:tetratricopeptide (TPR) repeat protein